MSRKTTLPNPKEGEKFGRFTVVGMGNKRKYVIYWKCKCECDGKIIEVVAWNLISGKSKSCGCLHKEIASLANRTHGHASHGKERKPEYSVWRSMIERGKGNIAKADYYDRGIRVCDRWVTSYENFYLDMGPRPSNKYTLERKDNDSGYEPSNCKWATRSEQRRNQRPQCRKKKDVICEHPDREHEAKGLCRSCYSRSRQKRR